MPKIKSLFVMKLRKTSQLPIVFFAAFFHCSAVPTLVAFTSDLTTLANHYGSDKGTQHKCAHNYTRHYEGIFARIRPKVLLEIGLNIGHSGAIPSLCMWKEYLGDESEIYGFDIYPGFLGFSNPSRKIKIMVGDQSNPADLQQCLNRQYDIIIDDGFHASRHQQVSLKTLWSSVRSGGCYVIEDLHWQPIPEQGMKTKELLLAWQSGNLSSSEYISFEEANSIMDTIDHIEMYDSLSERWSDLSKKNAFAVIFKK